MKALKLLLGLVVGLVLLLVLAMLALVLFVNPNTYKPKIEQLAASHQVELHIDGDLGWSFYPSLGIRAGKFSVKPPLDSVRQPFRFDDLTVSVKLLPLLHQRVEVERVLVHGNELRFAGSDGRDLVIDQLAIDTRDANIEQRAFPLHVSADVHAPSLPQAVHLNLTTQLALDAAGQHVVLSALALKVDDTQFTGQIDATLGKTPLLKLHLDGTALDLDRYFPPVPAPATEKQAASAPATPKIPVDKKDAVIPVASLQALPGEFEVTLKQLTMQHLHASDIALAATISSNALLTLEKLQLHAYDGDISMQATVDAHAAQPLVHLDLAVKHLSVAPALHDYLQADKPPLSGDLTLEAKLATHGLTQEQLMQHLDGTFSVQSGTLTLENVNLSSLLDANVLQLLQAKLPALMSAKNQTTLTQVSATGNVQQGVVDNTALAAKGLCSQFAGKGTYDLAHHRVQYRLGLTFPTADATPACGEINPVLKDKDWPFRCEGSLDDGAAKICGADKDGMNAIARDIARDQAKKALEKKLGDKVDSLKNAFKNLFH